MAVFVWVVRLSISVTVSVWKGCVQCRITGFIKGLNRQFGGKSKKVVCKYALGVDKYVPGLYIRQSLYFQCLNGIRVEVRSFDDESQK